jgi:hypothetical protein
MTIRELITKLEVIAREHGDDLGPVLAGDVRFQGLGEVTHTTINREGELVLVTL